MSSIKMSKLSVQPRSTNSAQENDFDAFFQQHWERMCTAVFTLTGDWHEAEDLVLEAFLRLYQKPPQEEQNLVGWVYRVAINLGLNALRARKRRQAYEVQAAQGLELEAGTPEENLDPALVLERRQQRQQVQEVLAEMKPRSATLLLLRYADFSYADIAAVIQVSPSSVGALLVRAEKEFEKKYKKVIGNS